MPVLNYYIYLSSIIMCFCLWIVLSPVLSFQPSYTILSLLVVLCHSLLELLSKIGYQNCIVLYRNDILKITTLKLAKIKIHITEKCNNESMLRSVLNLSTNYYQTTLELAAMLNCTQVYCICICFVWFHLYPSFG